MKAWNEMDIKEQKEVFAQFLASEIAKSLESGLEFKPNNRAYNGNVGNAYNGLNSLILDAKQHENGYESNVWVGLDDALKLGANPKEVEHIKNNTKEPNNNEMNMEQFNKMLEMAQNNPQMLAMLQQTLNKGAEQQKHDNYFANDEATPTQSKGGGR
ncbi:ArdC family protein [Helicobacter pylori]